MSTIRIGGLQVAVLNDDCEFRPCFRLLEDKGSFTPGVGYTSYHGKSRWVCGTRHLNGCPHVGGHVICEECHKPIAEYHGDDLPELAPSSCCGAAVYYLSDLLHPPAPCCDNPQPGTGAWRSKCKTCGTTLRGTRLEMARSAQS